jgi:cation transport regulator ChaC
LAFYFAYGSCMNTNDLSRTLPFFEVVGPATLFGYTLAFTKYSVSRQGGVADIVLAPSSSVEGVVFTVDNFEKLDIRELVYRRIPVNVQLNNSGSWLSAMTYEVVDKSPAEIAPSSYYASLILDASYSLSSSYRHWLMNKIETLLKRGSSPE